MNKNLFSWEDIQKDFENNEASLLLGKDFSCSVWSNFKDTSVYKQASSQDKGVSFLNTGGTYLSAENIKIFKYLGTESFEKVLAILSRNPEVVNEILDPQAPPPILQTIEERYQNIQRSLVQAIRDLHIPGDTIKTPQEDENILARVEKNREVLKTIQKELLKYHNLFSTSYDLIIFWSLMLDKIKEETTFRDYFKFGKFNPEACKINEKYDKKNKILRVFYLYGSLLLYPEGEEIRKLKNLSEKEKIENILDNWDKLGVPSLCMVEGTSTDKLRFINKSNYLLFAYERLEKHTNKLVILGNPVNLEKNQDKKFLLNQHLIDAIIKSKPDTLAISIIDDANDDEYKEQQIKYWEDVMKRDDIRFFDVNTHPLFHSTIRIQS